ncbi:MAG: hypothetical protein A2821_01205 [Candidatus Magasanikbacteria bacterium RIFCSPHIGHO2_01_FULL_41_23]|uniref:Dephospho-CoA kinase n=1 Tax=Candidatus Magasanikbacteria bacterium RIFCSPLOWO2_01_FULL_40_15 TaxID=1798686 RepID=A0A1F6N598_9BACT|nr:MAG: hypothetical protein A2821_01205 [Candidatus Magasanikbacteria bacterium RIFCSPHIGHO2_01_FULL_41_23]OGH74544.1 MAG: hypothetical protein A3F22_02915 [Candidatus Magasanikbacteria bacterium RIFCSPHIGHO2_12_FULL_41_16]OGH78833.1 MAG: hypothetical protein A2983_00665 [Candidatus Magasanikbacteria bacterium RIFCSPLOWO2_01_FULL_40_15]
MENKIILGLAGEMAAGKSTVTEYLKEKHNAVTFRFSDMLRDILKRIHVEPERANLQSLSTFVRQTYGEDIMSKVIAQDVAASNASIIITEGIRRPSDIVYLRKLESFHMIAINTNERTRFERIIQRHENPDDAQKTWEEFQAEGQQESEQKIKEIAAETDFTIDNNGTKEELFAQIEEIIKKIN